MPVDSEQATTTAWVLRAGCGCISAVSTLRYASIEQAWAKMVGGVSDQRRAVANGMTLSVQHYDAKLLAEIRDTAVTCDHPQISMRKAVARIRTLAAEMRTWCSPYGVATTYAQRLEEAIVGDAEPGAPRTTCPFCPPDLGEMTDVEFLTHIDTKHCDLTAGRKTKVGNWYPRITPELIATIINESAAGFARDTVDGGWMMAAARRILNEVTAMLDAGLAEHENEQVALMRRRTQDGLHDNAANHATRARAHQRDRSLVRRLLSAGRHD